MRHGMLLVGWYLAMLLLSPALAVESDRWDELMEKASTALAEDRLADARAAASEAVRAGEYENADRHVTSLALLARVEQESGDLERAEKALRQGIEVMDRIPGPLAEEKALLHNNLGAILDLRGDSAGAERNYLTALKIRESLPGAQSEARFALLLNLAGLIDRSGDAPRALALYRQAEASLPASSPVARAQLENNVGALYYRQGRLAEARAHLSAALAALAGTTSRLLLASLRHNLGTVALELGELDAAEKSLLEAEGQRRALLGSRHRDTARTLLGLALLRDRQGRPDAGLATAREGNAAVIAALAAAAGTSAAAATASERREWREGFALHLALLAKAEPDADKRAAEALRLMQAAKHGDLARIFASAAAGAGAGGDLGQQTMEIRAQLQRYQQKEKALLQELQTQQSQTARESRLRDELARERERLERLQANLARTQPRYHELVSGQVVDAERVRSVLRDDEAVLVSLVGLRQTFVVALTRTEARFFALPLSREAVDTLVRRIRASVDPDTEDTTSYAFEEAHRLYSDLLAPASSLLSGKAVWLIVPDGPLESLPLTLLLKKPRPSPAGSVLDWKGLAWVGREHALATLPSVGALVLARSQLPPQQAPEPLVAFADPVLAPVDAPGARAARQISARGVWGELRLADPGKLRALSSLPETADEARAVAATLGGGQLFLRQEAREATVKTRDLTRYRHVLFATHGAMASDFADFGEPALVMTPPQVASELDDGLLSANEIANLRLNAEWVLLSACNTAAADGTPGAEGLSGLAKSFFHAGARNLLVSHWPVVSEPTVLISTGAFAELARRPQIGKARALQASLQRLMDSDEYRHPLFWAPFVLVGEGS